MSKVSPRVDSEAHAACLYSCILSCIIENEVSFLVCL